jgi:hypothetical protein
MKLCFGMKSKKKQDKQKCSTLIQESQFKRSDGNRSSAKHWGTTKINLDKSIFNLTTNSRYENDTTKLSHETKSSLTEKQIFKNNNLSSKWILN